MSCDLIDEWAGRPPAAPDGQPPAPGALPARPPTADEELTAALAHFTAERLGLTLLYLVETVARTHPELLRRALGQVFDLTLYEEEARKVAGSLGRLHDEALALRRELRELRQQLAELERYRPHPNGSAHANGRKT